MDCATHLLIPMLSRRKPRITYKSPSEGDSSSSEPFTIPTITQKSASSSSASNPIFSKVSLPLLSKVQPSPRHWMSSVSLPLPLYHPLGRFASSLPPLNPTSIGLPCPGDLDITRRSSSRARRPAAKLRDGEEDVLPFTPPVIPDLEEKERPSPRKRRAGGGGSKRKRKEGDDDDATYPAKRTRMPRNANLNQALEEDSPAEPTVLVPDGMSTPEPAPEDRQLERRSTRSRGIARRDSSVSEAETTLGANFKKEVESTQSSNMGGPSLSDDGRKEKEEGELSEESRSNHLE